MIRILATLILTSTLLAGYSQNDNTLAREGNGHYRNAKYDQAVNSFTESLSANPDQFAASFNLGDALYRQEKYDEAAAHFDALAKSTTNKKEAALSYHNLGNSFLKKNSYKEAIEAYKKALIKNPGAEDTRYNLAYAQKKLKEQEEQEQENKDENQEDQDEKEQEKQEQNQEKQEQNQEEEDQQNQDNQDQQNKNEEQKKQEEQQQQEAQPLKMDKAAAEQMLDALENEERAIQLKLKKKGQSQKIKIEKDW